MTPEYEYAFFAPETTSTLHAILCRRRIFPERRHRGPWEAVPTIVVKKEVFKLLLNGGAYEADA